MEKKKNGFASGLGFVLAAAGSAVGLGNLWAFPYKTSANGGAAFVLIYIACVLFIGVVAMLTEIFIGKRAEANPVTAYKKIAKGLGCFGVVSILIPFFIATYYSVLGGYTVKYAMNSFAGNAGIFESFAGNVGEVILYTAIF
ncbi:MAG: sodium-dependent transporter, partial [Clostridia bacterium]|nr:sodium-dependent transporter [Clostridia bacterium]